MKKTVFMSHRNIKSGNDGLNLILDMQSPGIKNPLGSPVKILIKGGPGHGKSILALQFANFYAKDNKVLCIYYGLEEKPEIVLERLHSFWGVNAVNAITATQLNQPEPNDEKKRFIANAKTQGGIIISRFEFEGANPFLPGLEQALPLSLVLEKLPEQMKSIYDLIPDPSVPHMIVIDSLNALISQHRSDSEDVPRMIMEKLLGIPGMSNCCAIFVSETEKKVDNVVQEYLADVVIELGISADDDEGRFIRVLKARGHRSSPSRHYMEIEENAGIKVYPNIQLLSKVLDRGLTQARSTDKTLHFGITDLDNDLSIIPIKPAGISSNSASLIYGELSFMNSMLGLKFVKEGLLQNERSILVAVQGVEDAFSHVISNIYDEKTIDSVYKIVDFAHMHPSKLATEFLEIISEVKTKKSLVRLVMMDLRELFDQQGNNTLDLIKYLLKLVKQHNISPLFVYSTEVKSDIIDSGLGQLFDNIIETRRFHGEKSGKNYLGSCVRKVDGVPVNRPLRELSFIPEHFEIHIEPTGLENLVEMRPGEVGFGKMIVHYYEGETPRFKELWDELNKTNVEMFPHDFGERPEFRPFSGAGGFLSADEVLGSVLKGPPQAWHALSEILTFNENWAEVLIESGKIIPIPNEKLVTEFLPFDEYPLLDPVQRNNKIYGIPFYGNCSVLAYDQTLIKEHYNFLNPDIQKIIDESTGRIKEISSWQEVFEIAQSICEAYSSKKGNKDDPETPIGFLLNAYSYKCLIGLFLELLWYMGIVDEKTRSIRPDKFMEKEVIDKLSGWRDKYNIFADKIVLGNSHTNIPRFVFSRMWYTQLLSLKFEKPKINFGMMKVPSLKTGNHESISLVDNWYFGIIEGSRNERWARKMVNLLTSRQVNDRVVRLSAALPIYKEFWEKGLIDRDIVDIYKKAKLCSLIKDYIRIRPALISACQKIIVPKSVNRNQIENAMVRLAKEIEVLQSIER